MRALFGFGKAKPSKKKAEKDRRAAEAEEDQKKAEEDRRAAEAEDEQVKAEELHALREVPSEQKEEHAPREAAQPDTQDDHAERDRRVEEGPAIGIDLGTTYSCVGVVRNGRVEIIQNEHNNRITPSYVAFDEHERYVGEGAFHRYQKASDPKNVVFEVKRLVGRKFSDEIVQSDLKRWPFKVVPGDQNQPLVAVQFKGQEQQFAAEEISAMLLSKMKEAAEVFVGRPITKAVVTVPAYFTDSQRQATKVAGEIAGLDVMLILNEPAAAALAYSLGKKDGCTAAAKRSILIFDLGGGTFDVSLLELDPNGVLETKGKGGDTHLGGADFTNCMVDHLADLITKKHKNGVEGNGHIRSSSESMRKLRAECETAKHILSTYSSATIEINGLFPGFNFKHVISRARFEDLNKELFDKCMESLRQCLEDAKVSKESIDDVVLVGGSTRMPKIQELLKDFFPGKALCTSINATEAVAYGAALKAAELSLDTSQVSEEIELVDVTPLSLGIERTGGVMSVVVPKNTRIPCTIEKIFCNVDRETWVYITVYEGERGMVAGNNFLGRFELHGIEAKPGGTVKIPVKFHVDANGILTVSARIEGSSRKELITINKSHLTEEEIRRMIRRAERYKHEDEQRRIVADAKSELEGFVLRIRSRAMNPNVIRELSATDRNELESAISSAQNWLEHKSSSAEDLSELESLREVMERWGRKLQECCS